MNKKIVLVIPVYQKVLAASEQAALDHNLQVLSRYDVAFVVPEDLDTKQLRARYPHAAIETVSKDWLGRRGFAGYNEMMMSPAFYERFLDYEFMLICHTDAWVFRDDLEEWIAQGYDLVAAPWPKRPRYQRFPLNFWLWLRLAVKPAKVNLRRQLFGKVGNGGLCLRRTAAFRDACVRHAAEVERYLSMADALYNEDVFFALVPKELRRPTEAVAMRFAFDAKPEISYAKSGRTLPMGCHRFNKVPYSDFWKQFVSASTM